MSARIAETNLAASFPTGESPETERTVYQLTEGAGFAYPLYFYIPSMTKDGRYLIYHYYNHDSVQLYCLDLATGDAERLTDATSEDAHWRRWCTDPGTGVLDHRSVLNRPREEVYYFEDTDVYAVDVPAGEPRYLFSLPSGRRAIGQNCVTPDGEWLVYIHHDANLFDEMSTGGTVDRHLSRATVLAAYHLDSDRHHEILRLNSPIHHVTAYDDRHVVFCHPVTENGMLFTDLDGGWYSHLRTQDRHGGTVCHYHATDRGLSYEVLNDGDGVRGGIYDPFSHERVEFPLPDSFGYTHTGFDPAGELFFYENETDSRHEIQYLARYRSDDDLEWETVVGDWPTYGAGQKAHFHPRLTPDRNWMVVTAGDEKTESNHIFLVDVSDLERTTGIQRSSR